MNDKHIFGLRFGSGDDLLPSPEDIRIFLESPKKEGRPEKHGEDLAPYAKQLDTILTFEGPERFGVVGKGFSERACLSVLSHTCFFSPGLKTAVEQYLYHLHTFLSLDLRKPEVFIKSAEEELAALKAGARQTERAIRLRDMVDERKTLLVKLKRQRQVLADELERIAFYVRDNLVKIEQLCETAKAVLSDVEKTREEEQQQIDEIKASFKEDLRNALHQGQITKKDLEKAKHDVDILSQEIAEVFREDTRALSRLYGAVYDHSSKFAGGIGECLAAISGKKDRTHDEEKKAFTRIEQLLISLLTDHQFELQLQDVRSKTKHRTLLLERRQILFELVHKRLKKERRAWEERRTGEDRRQFNDPDYDGPERRSGKERRTGGHRRRS